MFFFTKFSKLQDFMEANHTQSNQINPIVQEYITNPHLINKKKYDLRMYVYIKSIEPLVVFIYRDGLVRFASKPFSLDAETFADPAIHITNSFQQAKVKQKWHFSVSASM